jgi:plastocyanin
LGSGFLAGSLLLAGADIHGNILVVRKLTHRNVTPTSGIYQRGVAVELGKDAPEDPLAFERSHVAVYIEGSSTSINSGGVKASMEQKDRRFAPDLVVIPAGSSVAFPNFDPIFHNVFSLSKAKSFDLGNYSMGQTRVLAFPTPGMVAVYCHLHSNMTGTIVVTPNQWATVADGTGAFTLKDVAPGTYTVVAWHKTAGTFKKTLTIGERDSELSFTLPYTDAGGDKPIAHR